MQDKINISVSKGKERLLESGTVSILERLRLCPFRRFTDRRTGEHLSGRTGSSNEFSDYRSYVEGDDFRKIDWNIFCRLREPFVKLFYEEQEMNLVIMIDNSSSMKFEDKFLRLKQLALAFGIMGLSGGERVSLYTTNGKDRYKPSSGKQSLQGLEHFIDNLECGGDIPIEEGIKTILRYHKGKGMTLVLSDFLTGGDIKNSANRIFNAGLELYGVQLLGPSEIDPTLSGDISLFDCESGEKMDISTVGSLIELYHEHRINLECELDEICRKRSGKFVSVSSDQNIESMILTDFKRRGWVK